MNSADRSLAESLRGDVRRFLADASPSGEVRRLMETTGGYDPEVWRQAAACLRLPGLLVPVEHGGWGGTWLELSAVLQEAGRALWCAPFLSTVLATTALLHSHDEKAKDRLLPEIASGGLIATVAFIEDDGRWHDPDGVTVASASGRGYRLEGHKAFVLDGHAADVMVVPARTPSGTTLFTVEAGAPGVTVTPSATMDQTRKLARIELSGAPARRLGAEGEGGSVLHRVLDLAVVALAAEQVGGAQRCLEMAVGHARTRHQFGRPIGSFQAVQHACADMLIEVESARSAADHAANVAAASAQRAASEPGDPTLDLSVAASLAKVCCSDAYFKVAAANIQLHGGTGFSWDHDAHLYFKRAASSNLLFGDPAHHRRLLARRIGL